MAKSDDAPLVFLFLGMLALAWLGSVVGLGYWYYGVPVPDGAPSTTVSVFTFFGAPLMGYLIWQVATGDSS